MGCQASREDWDGLGKDLNTLVEEAEQGAEEPPPAAVPTSGPLSAKDYKSRLTSSEGTQTVKFPTTRCTIKFAFATLRGLYPDSPDKPNQDSLCALPQFGGDEEQALFGVFDGHGEYGTECSLFARDKVPENLLSNQHFIVSPEVAFVRSMVNTNSQLHAEHSIDDAMAGTTAICALMRGRTLYVANVGDSRAVLAERKGDSLQPVDLSFDQTPFRRDECDRVKRCGARVLTLDQLEGLKDPDIECWGEDEDENDGDPPRLWAPNASYPGAAFTRSIGDATAERIGVFAEPEVVTKTLHKDHPFLVLASDGVWEFLTSKSVVDMVSKFGDPQDACLSVVAESYRLWLANDTRTDDITMIVVQFHGLVEEEQHMALTVPIGAMMDFSRCPVGPSSLQVQPLPAIEATDSEVMTAGTTSSSRGHARTSRFMGRALSKLPRSQPRTKWAGGVVIGSSPSSPHSRGSGSGLAPAGSAGLMAHPGPSELRMLSRAVWKHFLLRALTAEQRTALLGMFEQVKLGAGHVLLRQGETGEQLFVIETGEYDVFINQPGADQPEYVHTYKNTPGRRPITFGELALVCGRPRAATVVARTAGTLWALSRTTLRQALRGLGWQLAGSPSSEADVDLITSILRDVETLKPLGCDELARLAAAMTAQAYAPDEALVSQGEQGNEFVLLRSGTVSCTMSKAANLEPVEVMRLQAGQYFGERALLASAPRAANVVAVGDVVHALKLSRAAVERVLGCTLSTARAAHTLWKEALCAQREVLSRMQTAALGGLGQGVLALDELQARGVLLSTDCSATMLMEHSESGAMLTVRITSVADATNLERWPLVLRAREITRSLEPSFFVPGVLKSFKDDRVVAEVLTTSGLCTVEKLVGSAALDERSAAFVVASLVLGLEHLHFSDVVYRGLSAATVIVNDGGQVQLVDFRFATHGKGRAFTLCGYPEYLAPETVLGQGAGTTADLWALGVLTFALLTGGDTPFAAPGDDEMHVYRRVAKCAPARALPPSASPQAADFVSALLRREPGDRLGARVRPGLGELKAHPWLSGINWEALQHHELPPPPGIRERMYNLDGLQNVPFRAEPYSGDANWIQGF
mmetsp:Transcript_42463/g.127296  ORF Transcript_42463/g.127296 Transcript_42463/m.127296 type:complete len:1094 (-) Transcript_42463:580-3861(-)